jgi:hypothetical protein
MKIYCCSCKKYVGEVRDASLMKGIVYLCPTCKEELLSKVGKQKEENNYGDFAKVFGDMFGVGK